ATAGGVRPAAAIAVRVAPPKLRLFLSGATSAGQKASITVQASDSTGAGHNLVAPLTVTLVSTNSAHAAFDSATITIPAGGSSGSSGVTFDTAGSYVVTASTPGYADGVATTTTSGALVAISDFQFTPTTVTIQAGQYVTWKNNGPSAHTPTSDANLWSAGQVAVGQIGYVYFGAPGTFAYHCSIHPTMTATVIVQ